MNHNAKPASTQGAYVSYNDMGDWKLWFPHTQRQLMMIDDPSGRLSMMDVQALLVSPDDIEAGYEMVNQLIIKTQRAARITFAVYAVLFLSVIALSAVIYLKSTDNIARVSMLIGTICLGALMRQRFTAHLRRLKTGGIMFNIAHYEKKHDTEIYVNLTDIQAFIREQQSPWNKTKTPES